MQTQSKTTIYINARFLTQPVTGVQRYATELIKALDFLIDVDKFSTERFSFILLSPHNIKYNLNLKNIKFEKVGFLSGHLWEQIELPFYTQNGFLVNLTNTAPLAKFNQLVTVHDVSIFAVPDAYSWVFRNWYKFLIKTLKNTARTFTTVSFFSKEELLKYIRINEEKVHVIYEGKEHIFSVEPDKYILEENNLLNRRFIFVVSSMSPHKNFSSITHAIEKLIDSDICVVIAGISYPKVFMPPNIQLSEKVIHLGYVSNSELRALYEHAFCFLHPSLYEGFGLPPLEAMACGCPVIVSNISALPEICGDAALYCDPLDPEDIANKVRELINSVNLQEDLKEKGTQRSKYFTWNRCAQDMYSLLDQVVT